MLEGKKDFLTVQEFSPETLEGLIDLAMKMKKNKKKYAKSLDRKKLAMIFKKSSTRTRVSFEMGIYELGGIANFLSPANVQIGRGEPIVDTAGVLSRYVDGIMIRTFEHQEVLDYAKYGSIPVINGLTDDYHPCQALADFQTIAEYKGSFKGKKVAFVGDGNNVSNSFGLLATKLGADFAIASPEGYQLTDEIVSMMKENAKVSGSKLIFTDSPAEAVKDADVIYTDVWTSMGQEEESAKRLKAFEGYIVDEKLAKNAKSDYIFLHCLPAHRGEEVAAEVIDGQNSAIYDEAENRLHAQKAVMYSLMKD